MGDKPTAELFDGAVFSALIFPFGQVHAQAIGDVGTDKGLVAAETKCLGRLLEVVNDVIGQAEGD
jgi:hypothetical protein